MFSICFDSSLNAIHASACSGGVRLLSLITSRAFERFIQLGKPFTPQPIDFNCFVGLRGSSQDRSGRKSEQKRCPNKTGQKLWFSATRCSGDGSVKKLFGDAVWALWVLHMQKLQMLGVHCAYAAGHPGELKVQLFALQSFCCFFANSNIQQTSRSSDSQLRQPLLTLNLNSHTC